MKKLLFTIIANIWLFSSAQESPYFYMRELSDEGIETDEHARNLKGFCFLPDEIEENQKNILRKNENNECIEFDGNGQIQFIAYLEHATKYYYDKNINDPSKAKKDWDYSELITKPDYTYTLGTSKSTFVFGSLVFIIKVDGKEAVAFTLQMASTDFKYKTSFQTGLWNVDNSLRRTDDNKIREPTVDEKYIYMKHPDAYFPLMYYMRDNGSKGSHKIEVEVYVAKVECEKTAERSNELICKGEFTLTLIQKDIDDMKKAGGPKYEPNAILYPVFRNWFNKI